MSEPEMDERSIEQRLARAASAVPGVLQLEPSLARAISNLAGLGRSAPPDPAPVSANASDPGEQPNFPDGVTIRHHEDSVDVTIDVSVVGPRSALDVAVAVRGAVEAELALPQSPSCGAVTVRVLALERDAATQGPDSSPG